ncbi:PH domain-containing protein [Actinomadura rayongensis]|uniref:PH domain-containing protein n=1 Tax=Actinomadura rayongensis TaxID=1429076 RepID=A0A6I4W1F2_9ACTN|nr:PH domain-containing protein [Actinomadura rayongensis]MXQ64379.1 PH domain-containing protein [Actinomadura rayongensis]
MSARPELRVRSTAGRVAGWAFVVFAVLNLLDLLVGFTGAARHDRTGAAYALALLFGCALAYALGLRPAILGDGAGVTVRNPLRDTRAPWRAVREVAGGAALTVRFAGPDGRDLVTRAWIDQTSPRAQAKAEKQTARESAAKVAAATLKGRTPATYTAERLNEIARRHRGDGAETGTVSWSWPTVAALVVPPVALAVLLAV